MHRTPVMYAMDIVAREMFGWGLTRTMTIADGYEKCDFRYKKGGKTNIKTAIIFGGQSRK